MLEASDRKMAVLKSIVLLLQNKIPNGDVVPHPCKPNFIWRGVGHLDPLGGGERNPFGLDFARNGHKWTRDLCEMDSDGDGLSNGQELGDPNCLWSPGPGRFPERSKGITHPGICDPWGSSKCQERNKNVSCKTDELICPEIYEPHVRNMTLSIPRTKVPTQETTYMCMSFELEFPAEDAADQLYHMIATKGALDNLNVMHHLVMYGCDDSVKTLDKPEECYMSAQGCERFMGLWTLGMPGECFYKEAGFLLGKDTRKIMLQFHWTNPELVTDYYDASGMTLYYTKQLRKYNAGVLITGQNRLDIPPGKARTVVTGICSSECTEKIIKGDIYVTRGLNHMHYLGYEENVELFRNGTKVIDLIHDPIYSYDSPVMHDYAEPIKVMAGDMIKTTCVYRSTSKTRSTFWGEGTYDEMCYGIMNIFPVENITSMGCISWGNIDQCGRDIGPIKICDIGRFYNKTDPHTMRMRKKVMDNCNFYGGCRPECHAAVADARKDTCLQGEVGDYMMQQLTWSHDRETSRFLSALTSCDCRMINYGDKRESSRDEFSTFTSSADKVCATLFFFIAAFIMI